MAATKKIRIGIKDIRDLSEGWTLWDTRVSGFCARRRKCETNTAAKAEHMARRLVAEIRNESLPSPASCCSDRQWG
jgi:hypothetical protein